LAQERLIRFPRSHFATRRIGFECWVADRTAGTPSDLTAPSLSLGLEAPGHDPF